MTEQQEVPHGERSINSGTNIRLPIGLVLGFVASVAVFLWAQIEQHRIHTDQRFNDQRERCERNWENFEIRLDAKADKSAASDRYTGQTAAANNERFAASLASLQRQQITDRENMQREIDHMHSDLDHYKKSHLSECRK